MTFSMLGKCLSLEKSKWTIWVLNVEIFLPLIITHWFSEWQERVRSDFQSA